MERPRDPLMLFGKMAAKCGVKRQCGMLSLSEVTPRVLLEIIKEGYPIARRLGRDGEGTNEDVNMCPLPK